MCNRHVTVNRRDMHLHCRLLDALVTADVVADDAIQLEPDEENRRKPIGVRTA